MDSKILALAEKGKAEEISAVFDQINNEKLQSIVLKHSEGSGSLDFIRAVFLGSSKSTQVHKDRHQSLFKLSVKLLQDNTLQSKVIAELLGILLHESDGLRCSFLVELVQGYLSDVKSPTTQLGKSLELLPKLLSVLSEQGIVTFGGNHMTGPEYKSHIINSLCSGKWASDKVIAIANMFRDIPLTTEELKLTLEKIIVMFNEVDMEELPPLIYQLLLLSSKGHRRLVLEGICNYFKDKDKEYEGKEQTDSMDLMEEEVGQSCDTLRHTEGTIMLHITFTIKQDQDLGREYVKYMKALQLSDPTLLLCPFNLAMSLSIARIHRFQEQVYDILKSAILKSFRDADKRTECKWIREMVPVGETVSKLLQATVENSKYGWDQVTEGLVELGFILMDSYGPKSIFGKTIEQPVVSSPSQMACDHGATLLQKTFQTHNIVRPEIIEQLLNRVVTKTTTPVSHYIELLRRTVLSNARAVLECQCKVREAFDYLALLPLSTTDGLLRALHPLLKISMSLKDSLLLVLKKAMFSRQLEARKVAVNGFLVILKHFKIIGGLPSSQSCSQSSQHLVDVHTPYNPSSNQSLCLEILGNLRRCFTHQADVRLILYEGLPDVLARNTELQQPIVEMLHQQLRKYYESNEDVNPPIKLEACVSSQKDQTYLVEPLAHLLCCVQQCLVRMRQIRSKQTFNTASNDLDQSEIEKMMTSLTNRMIKSELEDFELDKSADYSLGHNTGVRNNIFAILVLGIYEVLIEYNFMVTENSSSSYEDMIQLYENYHKLSDLLKERASANGAKKSPKTNNKISKSLMSIRCVTQFLQVVFSGATPGQHVKLLRDKADMVQYIVNVVAQKLHQIADRGRCEGAEGSNKDKIFMYCCTIAKIFLKQYWLDTQSNSQAVVDSLCSIFKYMSCQAEGKLVDFLQTLEFLHDPKNDSSEADVVFASIQKFQQLIQRSIAGDQEEHSNTGIKNVAGLFSIISLLFKYLSNDSSQSEQTVVWTRKICEDHKIEDVMVAKTMLTQLLQLTSQSENCVTLLRDISQDIHSQLGDIDENVEVDDTTHLAVINKKTAAPTVALLLLQHFDKELDNTDWILNSFKYNIGQTPPSVEGSPITQRESHEKNLCTRLGIMVTCFYELCQSALPPGGCIDNLLKIIAHMYNTLSLFSKYYLAMYTQGCGHFSARFEKLVKLTGTHLTQHVYAFINYAQHEQIPQKKGQKKATSGKARISKESKYIPNLIYAIEQYERFLIQLTKKSKVDLMEHIKLSTSRDFRIKLDTEMLTQASQESSDDDDNESTISPTVSSSNQENQIPNVSQQTHPSTSAPPAKKFRLGTRLGIGKSKATKAPVV